LWIHQLAAESFTSALCCVLSGIHNLLFLVKFTREQCAYLDNATTMQFQSKEQKCNALRAIPKLAHYYLATSQYNKGDISLCE